MSEHPAVLLERTIMDKMPELRVTQFERAEWKDIIVGVRRRRSGIGRQYDEPQTERMLTWQLSGGRGIFVLAADESIAQFHLTHRIDGRTLRSRQGSFIGGWMRVARLDSLRNYQLDALTRAVNRLEA